MAIIASLPHHGHTISVEVLDVFEGSNGRKLARVRATSGQPFTTWTHGGWSCGDLATIPAALLTVAIPVNAVIPAEVES